MKHFNLHAYQQVLIDAIKRESYLPRVTNVRVGTENDSPRMTFDVHMPHDRGSIKSSATISFEPVPVEKCIDMTDSPVLAKWLAVTPREIAEAIESVQRRVAHSYVR